MATQEGHLGEQPHAVLHASRLGAQGHQLAQQQAHLILICPAQLAHRNSAQQRLQQPATHTPWCSAGRCSTFLQIAQRYPAQQRLQQPATQTPWCSARRFVSVFGIARLTKWGLTLPKSAFHITKLGGFTFFIQQTWQQMAPENAPVLQEVFLQ